MYNVYIDSVRIERIKIKDEDIIFEEKFGKNAILKARDYVKGATAKERNEQVGGHKGGES